MRIAIECGHLVVANGKLAVVMEVGPQGNVTVTEYGIGTVSVVDLANIQPIPQSRDSAEYNKRNVTHITERSASQMILAGERSSVIELFINKLHTAKDAAALLGVKKSAFYELVKRYSPDLGPVTLIKNNPGPKPGSMRTDTETIHVIKECYDKHYHGRSASYANVWRQVQSACHALGVMCPSLATVKKIIKSIDEKETFQKKHGSDATNQIYQSRPGIVFTDRPLQVAQMDHTRVDLILRAEHDRTKVIGRPWLTVIIDVHTRVILGYYLTMFAPSLISVQQAMGMAILPKSSGYFQLASESNHYPYFGFPERLLMDNAAEFRSPILEATLRKYKINPEWRIIGKKHMGGHIERLIGTFMTSAVHFLPGTTFSNIQQRGDYDSEKHSALTFKEFCTWFAGQVLIYHGTVHSQLKKSPKDAWEQAFREKQITTPELVVNPQTLYLDFLPEKIKPVRNNGITLNTRRYYTPKLNRVQGRGKVIVKFDPYDLTVIWVNIEGVYVRVPQVSLVSEFSSYEDYRCDREFNKQVPAGTVTDDDALRQIRTNNALVKNSQRDTRSAKLAKAHQEGVIHHRDRSKHGIPNAVWNVHISHCDDSVASEPEVNFSLIPQLFDQND